MDVLKDRIDMSIIRFGRIVGPHRRLSSTVVHVPELDIKQGFSMNSIQPQFTHLEANGMKATLRNQLVMYLCRSLQNNRGCCRIARLVLRRAVQSQ